MAVVIKPPQRILIESFSIFLAGSIENNTAENWQLAIENELDPYDVTILNPRRDDWKKDAKQSISDPYFNKQVNWELDSLNVADLIFMYFQPGTISPISLMELGYYAHTDKMLVCCPEGFWRKGNVDIICERENIRVIENFEEAIDVLLGIVKGACSEQLIQ
jgi:hypothetical protein